jgi:hypothetical protein
MAKDEHNMACGLHLCGKCSKITGLFGIIFLIQGLGLYSEAWFSGWTIVGVYLALLGLGTMMKM